MQLVTLIMHIYLNMTRSKQSIIIVIYSSPKAGRVNKVAKTQCQLITFTKLYSTLLLSLSYFKKKKNFQTSAFRLVGADCGASAILF